MSVKFIASYIATDSTQSTVTFSSIPQTYKDLLLLICAKHDDGGSTYRNLYIRANSDSTNSYFMTYSRVLAGTIGTGGASNFTVYNFADVLNGSQQSASNYFSPHEIYFHNYSSTVTEKNAMSQHGILDTTNSNYEVAGIVTMWNKTDAITSLVITPETPASEQFVTGSTFYLYGISG